MRIIAAATIFALTIAPAFAQKKTEDEKKRDAEYQAAADRQYRSSLGNIPEQNAITDPWSNMRGTPAQAAKPAAGSKPRQ